MKHLELHILQSSPVACYNRDDFGSPKTVLFGNALRARVSSQCWKRAIRDFMREESPEYFAGKRTRLILEQLRDRLQAYGFSPEAAQKGAEEIASAIVKLDNPSKGEKATPTRTTTLFFTSPKELDAFAKAYNENKDKKDSAKEAVKSVGKIIFNDAADIALFGRMVANDHSLTVEGAAMFSHAISTHKVSNEIDFFTAVDDLQPEDNAGAGMTGILEYNSATYYRFAALNLDMLADQQHLARLSLEDRQNVVRIFIEATIKAVPSARKNSMNANTLPGYVLLVVREKGHPVQLVNAFESPVWSKGGLLDISRKKLEEEYSLLKEIWGLTALAEYRLPDIPLQKMLDGALEHVK